MNNIPRITRTPDGWLFTCPAWLHIPHFVGISRYSEGTTKRPLGGASTPLIQGASPTGLESTGV